MHSLEFLAIFVSMRRILGKLILLSLLIAIWSCKEESNKTGTLMDFVPENALVVLKISNWKTMNDDIHGSSFLSKFKNTSSDLLISDKTPLLKHLQPNSESLLCYSSTPDSVTDYTFISKQNQNIFVPDSIKDKTIESLKIGERTIQRITIDNNVAFTANLDSVFLASSSQTLLMDILDGRTKKDGTFKKVFGLPTSSEVTALIKGSSIPLSDSTAVNFTSWSALDLSIAPESFTANGITLATDSIPQLLNVFEGQTPQQNHVSELVPMNALGAVSFTFNDAEKFQKKLTEFRGETAQDNTSGVFGSVSEVGSIQLNNGEAVFVKSIDAALTSDALARFLTSHSTYRDIDIKSFSEPELFKKTFYPLIDSNRANFAFQVEDFFVFTNSESNAQELIGAFQNSSTLKNASYFSQTASDLSTASSLLIFRMQGEFSQTISSLFNQNSSSELNKIDFKNFPLAALQLSYDRNFAHVSISCREFGGAAKNISKGVVEKFSLDLKSTILGNPQVFENGSSSNVAVQDVANKLYYISENGKILWTRELGNPILGEIQEVDIYGNGNKQLAFATKKNVYLVDRNGKDVKSFPLKFKDEITLPLSVFDYDNNRNYRFAVVQNKELLLYDKSGKTVRGFGFNKTKSEIVQSPSHIRMGNKDYIIVPEKSGKLNILSRVGKSRVTVSKTFDFSEIPVTSEDNHFVVITTDNTKERISEKGAISSQKLDVGNNYWFSTLGNVKATIDDNLLRVDGKLMDLPIGLYSRPELFSIHRKVYIGITETQEKKVYLFDKDGIVDGFPVYGSSRPSMGANGSQGSFSLATKGNAQSVILYSIE